MNTRNISGKLLCFKKKPIRPEKTEPQVCAVVASSHVLIFALIGHNEHPFDISSV